MVDFAVASGPVKPNVLNPIVFLIQVTHPIQLMLSSEVFVSSLIPLVSGQAMPPHGGKNPNVSMMSGITNVIGSQTHMVGISHPSSSAILNHVGSSKVQYQ